MFVKLIVMEHTDIWMLGWGVGVAVFTMRHAAVCLEARRYVGTG